jgi:hypothetical protein
MTTDRSGDYLAGLVRELWARAVDGHLTVTCSRGRMGRAS